MRRLYSTGASSSENGTPFDDAVINGEAGKVNIK